jgi:hypothetical protein
VNRIGDYVGMGLLVAFAVYLIVRRKGLANDAFDDLQARKPDRREGPHDRKMFEFGLASVSVAVLCGLIFEALR